MINFTIIDYKIGNHKSLDVFIRNLGHRTKVSSSYNDIKLSDIIILPGIGAFPSAMSSIKELKLDNLIINEYLRNKPIIGICLGMQLLASTSYEFKETKGLNIIPGKVMPLKKSFNIGWNSVKTIGNQGKITIRSKDTFYFNHSYGFNCNKKFLLAETNDEQKIPSIIRKKNVYGIQFHPEKSQKSGKILFKNIIKDIKNNA